MQIQVTWAGNLLQLNNTILCLACFYASGFTKLGPDDSLREILIWVDSWVDRTAFIGGNQGFGGVRPACFAFEKGKSTKAFVNFYWSISRARQWLEGMEAIAHVASLKYQAWGWMRPCMGYFGRKERWWNSTCMICHYYFITSQPIYGLCSLLGRCHTRVKIV